MGTESLIIILIVFFVVIAGGVSFIVAIYNGLVQVKNNVEKTFNNIDVLLQERHDELPKLVQAAKGYMKHEQQLLKEIVELRMAYNKAPDVDTKIEVENKINALMPRLNILVEQYPDLKAIESFNHLQLRVSSLEEQIADRRELFNDSVNIYNIRIERFPDMLFARPLHYRKKNYLTVPEDKKEEVTLELDT